MTDWLTSADAARILRVTPATVRLMAREGRLRVAAETASGIRLFDRGDVERLATERYEDKVLPPDESGV